jgi:hypothetical protein
MDASKPRRPRRTKAELAKHDAELERLIQEMNDPKTTALKLGISNSHAHLHYRLRGMRRGYITDAERIKILAARKGVIL